MISVIVPVYNPGDHLMKCLDSIARQTFSNLQVLLVNDGSTDGSADICRQYAANDSRFKVIDQMNAGASSARNKGLRQAIGSYVSFVDSDDWLEAEMYELLLSAFKAWPVEVVSCEYYIAYPDREAVHRLGEGSYGLFRRDEHYGRIIGGMAPFIWNKLFSRDVLKGVWFNERVARGEDTLFTEEILFKAKAIYCDDRPLYHYVQSRQSVCRGSFRRSQLSVMEYVEESLALWSKNDPKRVAKKRSTFAELLITVYFDMYVDGGEWLADMQRLHTEYRKLFGAWWWNRSVSLKCKTKLLVFYAAPRLFSVLHKRLHEL